MPLEVFLKFLFLQCCILILSHFSVMFTIGLSFYPTDDFNWKKKNTKILFDYDSTFPPCCQLTNYNYNKNMT